MGGGVDLPDHAGPRYALEKEAGQRMREQAGITDAMDAEDLIRDGGGHHEQIVDLVVAGGGSGGLDYSSHLFEPTGG